ncbi:hypothetical protein ABIA99_005964 [Bradyrhizobium sp. LB12.1]|uniref:hypothetical protein n=1 Tax=Bradyrhizobium sp. LB12.1 TaxID=3156327 RepID=UPI00339701EE
MAPGTRIDVAIDFAPVHRGELARRVRKDLADLVMAQRDGGDRGELRGAAVVESIGIDGELASSGQIQSSGLIDTGPATIAAT